MLEGVNQCEGFGAGVQSPEPSSLKRIYGNVLGDGIFASQRRRIGQVDDERVFWRMLLWITSKKGRPLVKTLRDEIICGGGDWWKLLVLSKDEFRIKILENKASTDR